MESDNIKEKIKEHLAKERGMVLDYFEFHGTTARKPKGWFPELLYRLKKMEPGRVFAKDMSNLKTEWTSEGFMITSKYPMNPEDLERYNRARSEGRDFKIIPRPDKKIRILYDQNARQAVAAHNRRVGFEQYKIENCIGEVISLDIADGQIILKLIIKG